MTSYYSITDGPLIQSSNISYQDLDLTISNSPLKMQWPTNLANNTKPITLFIRVNCTQPNAIIQLDSVVGISLGQFIIFHNIGAQPFVVQTVNGTEIASVDSGKAQYVYLNDNTTPNGSWGNFTFGAGTSGGDATSLAGFGLIALNNKLNTLVKSRVIGLADPKTITTDDYASLILMSSTGTVDVLLPALSSVGDGFYVCVKNVKENSGVVTLKPQGSDKIDNDTKLIFNQGESACLVKTPSLGWRSLCFSANPLTGQVLLLKDGTVSSPSLAFESDLNSGLYFDKTSDPLTSFAAFSSKGRKQVDFTSSGVTITESLNLPNGSQTVPAMTFGEQKWGSLWGDHDQERLFVSAQLMEFKTSGLSLTNPAGNNLSFYDTGTSPKNISLMSRLTSTFCDLSFRFSSDGTTNITPLQVDKFGLSLLTFGSSSNYASSPLKFVLAQSGTSYEGIGLYADTTDSFISTVKNVSLGFDSDDTAKRSGTVCGFIPQGLAFPYSITNPKQIFIGGHNLISYLDAIGT